MFDVGGMNDETSRPFSINIIMFIQFGMPMYALERVSYY